MAAPQALALVKQIEALVDNPDGQNLEDYLPRLLPSLQYFLEHSDNRVRNGSARTLLKLSRCGREQFERQDLSRARSVLEKCRQREEVEWADLEDLLAELLHEPLRSERLGKTDAEALGSDTASTAYSSPSRIPMSQHSDLIIELMEKVDETVKGRIRDKVVGLTDVVSITFEDYYVIVNVRTQAIASDLALAEEIVGTVKGLGVTCQQVIKPAFACADDEADPEYMDDEAWMNKENQTQVDDSMAEGGNPSEPAWTFFSQTSWTAYRKTQEYHEDPRIAARLAKAKQRREEHQQTRNSRLGLISSWFGWSRESQP